MARTRTAGPPETETTFEQAMNELEELVHALEDGTLPLDLLVEKYERGSGLLKTCRTHLDVAQQRIELITRKADGSVALEALPGGEGPTPAASSAGTPASPKPSAPSAARKAPSPDHANSDEIRLFQL